MLFSVIDGQLRHFCSKILRDFHYDSPYRLPKKFSVRGSWRRLRRKLRGKHRRVCPGRRTKVEGDLEYDGKRGKRRGGWLAWPIDQHWWFLRYPYVIVVRVRNMPQHREASLVRVHSWYVAGNFVQWPKITFIVAFQLPPSVETRLRFKSGKVSLPPSSRVIEFWENVAILWESIVYEFC